MRTLYEVKGVLVPCCSRSHIKHSFSVEKDLSSLYIQLGYDRSPVSEEEAKRLVQACIEEDTCAYSPHTANRLMESWQQFKNITNFVTLSLDDCNGFRGASHRGGDFLRISVLRDSATEGYTEGSIPQGTVSVTLSVHFLIKDCPYHLVVETD